MRQDLVHITLAEPPEILFYATDIDSADALFKHGLDRLKSPFIELFQSEEEALHTVSMRKLPSLFAVISGAMAEDGYRFYHAESGEWLTDVVPQKYLRFQ